VTCNICQNKPKHAYDGTKEPSISSPTSPSFSPTVTKVVSPSFSPTVTKVVSCHDDTLFVDPKGRHGGCRLFSHSSCDKLLGNALGYNELDVMRVLLSCPKSCGLCDKMLIDLTTGTPISSPVPGIPASHNKTLSISPTQTKSCTNDASYRDKRFGLTCEDHFGSNCDALGIIGYTPFMMMELKERCEVSCNTCQAPVILYSSENPTKYPSGRPSSNPSMILSGVPSKTPDTSNPSMIPSGVPSKTPDTSPTKNPSRHPSIAPTYVRIKIPSTKPSFEPSISPFSVPSSVPSNEPTYEPTKKPSYEPTTIPTINPSHMLTFLPTEVPCRDDVTYIDRYRLKCQTYQRSDCFMMGTLGFSSREVKELIRRCPVSCRSCDWLRKNAPPPTATPTSNPTRKCRNTLQYTDLLGLTCEDHYGTNCNALSLLGYKYEDIVVLVSNCPESCGVCDSNSPSNVPSLFPSSKPSSVPSNVPSMIPSTFPSLNPSKMPSKLPTQTPTAKPSLLPSTLPSGMPTQTPTVGPSAFPSRMPSFLPTNTPSMMPSQYPSSFPTGKPSTHPSDLPSSNPTSLPSSIPSDFPSHLPSTDPSGIPSNIPIEGPSISPTSLPSSIPSGIPTFQPSGYPSELPTVLPSIAPSTTPSTHPTQFPSAIPSIFPSQGCYDNTMYRNRLGMTCGQHIGMDCGDMQNVGFTQLQVLELQRECPRSCGYCITAVPSPNPSVPPTYSPVPTRVPSDFPSLLPSSRPTRSCRNKPNFLLRGKIPCDRFRSKNCLAMRTIGFTIQEIELVIANCPHSCGYCDTAGPSLTPSSLPSLGPKMSPTFLPSVSPSNQASENPSQNCHDNSLYNDPLGIGCGGYKKFDCRVLFKLGLSEMQVKDLLENCKESCGLCDTAVPSNMPTASPSGEPTSNPTSFPSALPTNQPTLSPTTSVLPSSIPSSSNPSITPTFYPSRTNTPSLKPSNLCRDIPTYRSPMGNRCPFFSILDCGQTYMLGLSMIETKTLMLNCPKSCGYCQTQLPSSFPSRSPFASPSLHPTTFPNVYPSSLPSRGAQTMPTLQPSYTTIFSPSIEYISEARKGTKCTNSHLFHGRLGVSCATFEVVKCESMVAFGFTDKEIQELFRSCTKSCGKCPTMTPSMIPSNGPVAPPSFMPSWSPTGCEDNKDYRSFFDQDCSRYRDMDCTMLTFVGGFTAEDVAELTQNCPKSCGLCESNFDSSLQGETSLLSDAQLLESCVDDSSYENHAGLPCESHLDIVCSEMGFLGLRDEEVTELLRRCPLSCGLCRPQLNSLVIPREIGSLFSAVFYTPPTTIPSVSPTFYPTSPTVISSSKLASMYPTINPNLFPSSSPSGLPTKLPNVYPSMYPTMTPMTMPTSIPSRYPSRQPSKEPTLLPSSSPSTYPSTFPSLQPTGNPTSTLRSRILDDIFMTLEGVSSFGYYERMFTIVLTRQFLLEILSDLYPFITDMTVEVNEELVRYFTVGTSNGNDAVQIQIQTIIWYPRNTKELVKQIDFDQIVTNIFTFNTKAFRSELSMMFGTSHNIFLSAFENVPSKVPSTKPLLTPSIFPSSKPTLSPNFYTDLLTNIKIEERSNSLIFSPFSIDPSLPCEDSKEFINMKGINCATLNNLLGFIPACSHFTNFGFTGLEVQDFFLHCPETCRICSSTLTQTPSTLTQTPSTLNNSAIEIPCKDNLSFISPRMQISCKIVQVIALQVGSCDTLKANHSDDEVREILENCPLSCGVCAAVSH